MFDGNNCRKQQYLIVKSIVSFKVSQQPTQSMVYGIVYKATMDVIILYNVLLVYSGYSIYLSKWFLVTWPNIMGIARRAMHLTN